jgi:hypothetical protein
MAIFDKPDPLDGPYFPETIYVVPPALSAEEQAAVESTVQAMVTALGLRSGPIHAEIRGNERGVFPIEIAARSIGGMCSRVLRFEGNRSLEDVIIGHALGDDQVPDRESKAAGVMMIQAPRTGIFREARGQKEAAQVNCVEEVLVTARPGTRLTPLPEGFLYAGFIFARGDTRDEVVAALQSAFERLEFVIE